MLGVTTINKKVHVVSAGSVSIHVKVDESRETRETHIVPFWKVERSDKAENCSMKLTLDAKLEISIRDLENIKIPLMKNSKSIKAGDRLVLFAPWTRPTAAEQPALKKQKSGVA